MEYLLVGPVFCVYVRPACLCFIFVLMEYPLVGSVLGVASLLHASLSIPSNTSRDTGGLGFAKRWSYS